MPTSHGRSAARGTFSVWGPLCSYLNGELYEDLYERLYNKVLSHGTRRTREGSDRYGEATMLFIIMFLLAKSVP